ncbi:GNAT family N-acetyltransferase [Methylobacterium sp. J-076]|uniref:GNAT family N-acetyltransferase n=1 Tax=Methylobacterium sp. J-076 TaxID=2836655 RepID=UPI001FB86DD5|nr:N-acetyltransferase [Methylobacterium sp. J-076]MCJ2014877.1 N-acetyltransferase [Methylobacterium sp. J-076]
MTTLSLVVRPERPEDSPAIARLEARAFGPGRFARTAYRLREGNAHRFDLGVTASVGSFLVGSVRISPVRAGGQGFLMLGPLAVDPSFAGRGIGSALTRATIEAARTAGDGLVILVGDAPYYARFGFTPVPPGRLVMPGPVDPARLLWLELSEGYAAGLQGPVEPAQASRLTRA